VTDKAVTPEVYCENCGALMVTEWSKEGDVVCILARRCSCEKIVTCWYKTAIDDEWYNGFFHQWNTHHEVFDSGPGHVPVAVVEDATDSRVHVVFAEFVSFTNGHPDEPVDEEPTETRRSRQVEEPVYESSLAKASREYYVDNMVDQGWLGEAAAAAATDAANADPKGKIQESKRFVPRLAWVSHTQHWVIQVHPDAIEVFNDEADYICQVRWIDGKMDYGQGGLPLSMLREMFEEANAYKRDRRMESECMVAHQEGRSRPLQDYIDELKESNE
jgi:hypothetical protein